MEKIGYIMRFLGENEANIDKATLVLLMLNHYIQEKNALAMQPGKRNSIGKCDFYINNARTLLNGCDKTVFKKVFDEQQKLHIKEISTRDLLEERRTANAKKLQDMLDKGLSLEDILMSLEERDFGKVFCNKDIGDVIVYQSYYNTAITHRKIIDCDNIEIDQQLDIFKNLFSFGQVFEDLIGAVREHIESIDLDKMLLCSAYRFMGILEEEELNDKEIDQLKGILDKICFILEGKNIKITVEKSQQKKDGSEIKKSVGYSVNQLKKDMEKFEGLTYWSEAKVQKTRSDVISGVINLRDVPSRVSFTKGEVLDIAKINEDNYLFAIERGLIDANGVNVVNQNNKEVPNSCLIKLLEKRLMEPNSVIELYLQGKVSLDNIKQLEIDFNETIYFEDILDEYRKEDNDERKQRYIDLYRNTIALDEEKKDENKENLNDLFLETEDAGYLEMSIELGIHDFTDLDGIMASKEWVKAYKNGQISERFMVQLQKNGLVNNNDLKKDKHLLIKQIQAWEKGKISTEDFGQLGLSIEEVFNLCEELKIKDVSVRELFPEADITQYGRQIESRYMYGFEDTISKALVAYNLDLINMDKAIELIEGMKISSSKLKAACEEGRLKGSKIAELRYRGCIHKQHFAELKDKGFISDREEIEVANNLTPAEMIRELETNGCSRIENLGEILEGIDQRRPNSKPGSRREGGNADESSPNIVSDAKIINPIKRHKLLELLGTDIIVTTPENGFKGYQAFLIPKLGIAVLEKLFRENRDGEIRPTYGDATYICEIGKYIQVSGQSKREIIDFMNLDGKSNGNVERIYHFKTWGSKLLNAIAKVNPEIEIKKEGDEIKSITRNGENVDIDIAAIQELISHMQNGDFSISMEVYN